MRQSDKVKNAKAGQRSDRKTGEVLGTTHRRSARVLTDDERAERDRVLSERAEQRRAMVAALRALNPACEADDDAPIAWRKPARIGGEPSGLLLDLPRVSGRGLTGSRLVVAARGYDGAGPNGGEPHEYALLFITYLDGAGNKWRTPGVAIRQAELRLVADTLAGYIDELDGRRAKKKPRDVRWRRLRK